MCNTKIEKRSKLGDPAFSPHIPEYEHHMTKPQTARLIHDRISDEHTLNLSAYNPDNYEIPSR